MSLYSDATSLLELIHPDGDAPNQLVVGSSCPSDLVPAVQRNGEQLDVIVFAPSPRDFSDAQWLHTHVNIIRNRLADDGFVYLIAPPLIRLRLILLLRRVGLTELLPVVHLAGTSAIAGLLPVIRKAVQFTGSQLVILPRWKQTLASIALLLPAYQQLFAYFAPGLGVVLRRPQARPLFEWLQDSQSYDGSHESAIVTTGWRGRNGSAIVYRLAGRTAVPDAIAKVELHDNPASRIDHEAMALTQLRTEAQDAGARVPRMLGQRTCGTRSVLIESMIGGTKLASLISDMPAHLDLLFTPVVAWLARWNQATSTPTMLTAAFLERHLLAPASIVVPVMRDGATYYCWLEERCAAAYGQPITLVATHNDLTMQNLLVDDRQQLGVIDWETACGDGLPLVDLFYAVVDVVLMAGKPDRLTAFLACFERTGERSAYVRSLVRSWRAKLGLTSTIVEICLHACWVHHAANEHQAASPDEPRPFLSIVEWLADHTYTSWEESEDEAG